MSAYTSNGDVDVSKIKNLFKCIVPGCRSSTITNIAKLHSFPWRDMPRAEKWITAVGRLELLGAPPKALLRLRVCDLHFAKHLKRGKNMKLWDNSAVPTLKLDSVRHPKTASKVKKPPVKKTKRRKCAAAAAAPAAVVNGTKKRRSSNVESPRECRESGAAAGVAGAGEAAPAEGEPTPIRLPRELARFLTLREKLHHRNTARKGYDKKFAALALNLHISSPSAYRVLWKSLRLPPPALLARVDVGVGTRLDDQLLKCFESKMERIDHREKECVLCIDEVALTKKLFYVVDKDEVVGLEDIGGVLRVAPATRALVLAARGVKGTWLQPLGYLYLALDTNMRDVVEPLRRLVARLQQGPINCRVRVVLAALGPTFAELADALAVTVDSPFAFQLAPRPGVCFMHDPDQLILTLRDTLMTYDIKFRDSVGGGELRASWRDVEALYQQDAARGLRLLPELTRARVFPSPRESLQVSHAAALFSRRVAAHMASRAGQPGDRSEGTARLLRLGADLRLALVSRRARDHPRVAAAIDAVSQSLRDMRIVSADGEEHDAEVFVRSLQVSLAGAVHALAERAGEEPLRLASCALQPVRRFVERIEGVRGKIPPREFRARFRRWTMHHLLEPIPARAQETRADDLAGLLWKAEHESLAEVGAGERRSVSVGGLQHRVDLSQGCTVEQAAAALLRECRRAHGCAAFVQWARNTQRFQEIVCDMDSAFKKMFMDKTLNSVGHLALPALAACLEGRLPCACFPRDTFCCLFVRFRIRAALLVYNGLLRGSAKPGAAQWLFL